MKRTALGILLVVLAIAACENATIPCDPPVHGGRVEGRVEAGGVPFEATVIVTRLVGGEPVGPEFETACDLAGHYSLDVPAGDYHVSVRFGSYRHRYDYTGGEPGYGNVPPAVVRIDQQSSPVGIDFRFGAMIVAVDLAERLEGENCTVRLHRQGDPPPDSGQSYVDLDGATIEAGHAEVFLAGVLPGHYRVELVIGRRHYACDCPWDGEHVFLPGTRDPEQADWHAVTAGAHTRLEPAFQGEPCRLEGSITGAWQELGADREPELSIVTVDSLLVMGRRRVDPDGTFAVDLHLPGSYRLLVTQSGVENWIGGRGFDEATVFPLQPGETVSGIEHVQSGLRLRVDAQGMVVGSLAVEVVDASSHETIYANSYYGTGATTVLANLDPGEMLIHVVPYHWDRGSQAWRPQWYDRAATIDEAQPIVIGDAGDIAEVDLILEAGGRVRGTVDRGSAADLDLYVLALPVGEAEPWGHAALFAPQSDYVLEGLPDGDYQLALVPRSDGWYPVQAPPEGAVWYPGVDRREEATVIEIRDAGEVSGIDFHVPEPIP